MRSQGKAGSMTKAVYCAGSGFLGARVRPWEQMLRADGAIVTSSWSRHSEAWAGKDDRLPHDDAKAVARVALAELRSAQVFWLFVTDKSATVGSFIELGIAMSELKTIVISGPGHRQSAFMALADKTFEQDSDAYAFVLRCLFNDNTRPIPTTAQASVRPGGAL